MTEKKPYIENKCSVRIISPKTEKRCFFGYYDLKAYDDSDRYHLCNIVEFENRFPTSSDVMELGVIDLDNGSYEKIDETTAWNFQQGAMLQWSRAEKDVIYFNTFKDGYRPLFFYDCKTKESDILTKSLVPYGNGFDDLRTDLHNRFNTKGDKISFDTIQNGKREIAELDFAEYIKKRG